PEPRGSLERDPAVHVGQTVLPAVPVVALQARAAAGAGPEDLHRHPLALRHPPSLGGPGAERLEAPHHLVARDEGEGAGEGAGVLLVVGAAEPARLDPQDPVALAQIGERKPSGPEPAGCLKHQRLRPGGRDRHRLTERAGSPASPAHRVAPAPTSPGSAARAGVGGGEAGTGPGSPVSHCALVRAMPLRPSPWGRTPSTWCTLVRPASKLRAEAAM